jgi:hypothetical protein
MAPTSPAIDERGLVVQESEMSGNLWLGDSYTLHVFPSHTRTGGLRMASSVCMSGLRGTA